MDHINLFFTTFSDKELKQEFDLEYLGTQKYQESAFAFSDGKGRIKSFGGGMYDVKQEHYDFDFYYLLIGLNPPYKLTKALDYHYNNYSAEGKEETEFLLHIEYVILPKIEKTNKSEYIKLTLDWINKNKQIMFKKHLEEKISFLNKAYEIAVEECPSSPLSYRMGTIEIGKSIGLDESSVKRIMQELVTEGFAKSGMGYLIIFITQNGLNYLRKFESSKNDNPATFNLTVGNNSNLQIQNATHNSSQSIEITSTNERMLEYVEELKKGMDILKQNMKPEEFQDLQMEVSYLEKNLKSSSPKKSLIKEVFTGIKDILKGVATEVIANVITKGTPD